MRTDSHIPQMRECSEPELIARIRAGEHDCFHELIRPYERAMFAIAYAVLRNAADAEDVVQEAAFKAFQHLDELRDDDKFRSWLLQITKNEAHARRRKDRQHLYESLEVSDEEEEDSAFRPRTVADWRDLPGDALDREELRQAIRDAVSKLPEKYQVVFVLADGNSLSNNDVAEALGLTIANVKTRLHRARIMLQEHLSPTFKPKMSDHIELLKGMNPWSRVRK